MVSSLLSSFGQAFAHEFHRRTRNASFSKNENNFEPTHAGSLGFTRAPVLIQERKLGLARRALILLDCTTRYAMETVQRRGGQCCLVVRIPAPRASFRVSSIISYWVIASSAII